MAGKKSKSAGDLLFFAYGFLIEIGVLLFSWIKSKSD